MALVTRPTGTAALILTIVAVLVPALYRSVSPFLTTLLTPLLTSFPPSISHIYNQPAEILSSPYSSHSPSYPSPTCLPHTYKTEIISIDPLLIYIDSFLSPTEIEALLEAGEREFAPSQIYKSGRNGGSATRTSSSAGLPRDNPAVQCVLRRAEAFLGTMLDSARDDIGPPQLVRYTAGQRFNRHHDVCELF